MAPPRYLLRSKARRPCQLSKTLNSILTDLTPTKPRLHRYKALDTSKQEVRILRLHGSIQTKCTTGDPIQPASSSEAIHGSISHVPLSELQNFVALSYTWGKPEKSHSLLVDGKRIPITKNLHKVLQHLGRKTEFAHVWIDAVCINQKDVKEKASQIQLLSRIFQSAREVVSWIGVHDDQSSFLFAHIRGHSLEDIMAQTFGEVQKRVNAALTALSKRPYWTRVWILQEFAVAKRVRIMCADDLVDSDLIDALASKFMRQREQSELLEVTPYLAMDLARRRHHEKRPVGLLEMLITMASAYENSFDRVIRRAFQSTDIIDQIYGLLGLVDDQKMFVHEPDYELKKLNELFVKMTRSFISTSGQLELCFLEHGKTSVDPGDLGVTDARSYTPAELPGWCPDYLNLVNSAQNSELINALETRQETPAELTGPKHRYSEPSLCWNATAESRSTSNPDRLQNDGRMILDGKLVGTIISSSDWETHIAPLALTNDQNELSCFSWFNLLLFAYTGSPVVTDDQILDALSFLLSDVKCVMKDARSHFDPKCCDDERRELKKRLLSEGVSDDLAFFIVRRILEWSIATDQPSAVPSEELHKVADQISNSLLPNLTDFGRRMAAYRANECDASVSRVVKESGAYSWVPSSARTDDEIWLLKGCSMPMVLRRIAQPVAAGAMTFARIGPALVNGAMRGEMWSDDNLGLITVVKTSDTVASPLVRKEEYLA